MPNEAEAAVNKIQRKYARAARRIFRENPDGRMLLSYICREANILNTNLPPLDSQIDPLRLAELEGKRSVALGMLELTYGNLDEPGVIEQITESILEDEETNE